MAEWDHLHPRPGENHRWRTPLSDNLWIEQTGPDEFVVRDARGKGGYVHATLPTLEAAKVAYLFLLTALHAR